MHGLEFEIDLEEFIDLMDLCRELPDFKYVAIKDGFEYYSQGELVAKRKRMVKWKS